MIKLSKQWLQEWLDVDVEAEQLAEQLTMAGLEVDCVVPVAAEFSHVVVGEVMKVASHPRADHLHVCQVNIGTGRMLNIICGAPNVHDTMKVAVALVGAVLPDLKIEKRSLRGIESEGMLCSSKELGLTETAKQILELPQDAPVGKDIREYLQLDDVSIEIDLTANRGDCASVRGIAREVAVINRCHYLEPKIEQVQSVIQDTFPITLVNPEACPRYVGRIIRNVKVQAQTPLWIQERLRRSGLHSIHPIVDITNYVLLELGQPLHAFDFGKLSEGIQIRFAAPNEKLRLLSGEEIIVSHDTLVIADTTGPIALAGIMGGELTGITEQTKDIFLESAFFNPVYIVKRARQYGLQTDAAYRFEHGVDSQLQMKAIERATQLLLNIVGGKPGPVLEIKNEEFLPEKKVVNFRPEKVKVLVGIKIAEKEMYDILQRLGMQIEDEERDIWKITVPTHRFDISIEEDFIEEVARIYGYDHLPIHHVHTDLKLVPFQTEYYQYKRVRALLQDRGYHEIITYSFIDPKDQKQFDQNEKPLPLVNPMVQDMSVMRTNLWPGLVKTLVYNLNRQQNRVRLFEIGLRFRCVGEEVLQEEVLSGLIYGDVYPEQWGVKACSVDFFDIKNDVESLLYLTGRFSEFTFQSEPKHPALHPGRSAALFLRDQQVGYVGMMHPQIMWDEGIQGAVYVFEVLLNVLQTIVLPVFSPISKFPTIRRDLAFIMNQEISSQAITDEIRKTLGEMLVDLIIFDVYQGENIESGKKSVALRLTLQHLERTLQDEEANRMIQRIVEVVERNFKAELRK
jgi:phenylalanyl-tRNA synthetase beta chain